MDIRTIEISSGFIDILDKEIQGKSWTLKVYNLSKPAKTFFDLTFSPKAKMKKLPAGEVIDDYKQLTKIGPASAWLKFPCRKAMVIQGANYKQGASFYVNGTYLYKSRKTGNYIVEISDIKELLKNLIELKLIENKPKGNILDIVAYTFYKRWYNAVTKDLPKHWALYKDFDFGHLKTVKQPVLYRGIRVSKSLGLKLIEEKKTIKLKDLDYSSWTTREGVAASFASGQKGIGVGSPEPPYYLNKKSVGLILKVPTAKLDIFLNSTLLPSVANGLTSHSESEVLVKGPGVVTITPEMVCDIY
jgi:hypothetical protein